MRLVTCTALLVLLASGCSDSPESASAQRAAEPSEAPLPATGRPHPRVPILMYHVIGDPRPGAPYPELFVGEADFVGQMRWLHENGYAAVTLHDVWLHWLKGAALPERPVVITFDDGSRGIATRAAPALAAYDWPGVLDLDLSNVKRSEGFGAPSIRRLVAAGWEVDSHSLTHADLTTVDDAQLEREVAGSREAIRRLFGEPAEFFCYPAGRFDQRVVDAVKAAGYLGATTTEYGLADRRDPYRLARLRVNRTDGVAGFARKLEEVDPR